ncbi:MAG: MarR family winged helix-turn-helix transcriptional regulator [Fusobacterium sp. JB021]|nr:MarR family winged helix-turn-helix transcriptional regulator [Fusobacterium sp. JB021]MDP0506303.1 MarR family winged helix-turn-helix transcriptional regulator [Fusobacterium sp. JB019]
MSYIKEVNEIFENFYKLFYESEDLALKNGIKCLTHTELHIIEAIGEDSITMNTLSERLAITMGTATVAITKLEEKGFAMRARSNVDRRKVYVSLTPKGSKALEYHNNYHKTIMATITENINKEDLDVFLKTFEKILANLKDKSKFLKPSSITDFPIGSKVSVIEIKGTPIVQDYFMGNGIHSYTELMIKDIKENEKIVLIKQDGEILELNALDAKNIIVVRKEG